MAGSIRVSIVVMLLISVILAHPLTRSAPCILLYAVPLTVWGARPYVQPTLSVTGTRSGLDENGYHKDSDLPEYIIVSGDNRPLPEVPKNMEESPFFVLKAVANYLYAKKHGYKFVFYQYDKTRDAEAMCDQRHASWCKLLAVQHAFNNYAHEPGSAVKGILWTDSDGHVAAQDVALGSFLEKVPDGSGCAGKIIQDGTRVAFEDSLVAADLLVAGAFAVDGHDGCAGNAIGCMWFVRNTHKGRNLLKEWWSTSACKQEFPWEQRALNSYQVNFGRIGGIGVMDTDTTFSDKRPMLNLSDTKSRGFYTHSGHVVGHKVRDLPDDVYRGLAAQDTLKLLGIDNVEFQRLLQEVRSNHLVHLSGDTFDTLGNTLLDKTFEAYMQTIFKDFAEAGPIGQGNATSSTCRWITAGDESLIAISNKLKPAQDLPMQVSTEGSMSHPQILMDVHDSSEAVPSTVVVTGVAGFIGSHTALALLARGYRVIGVDDYSRGHLETVEALRDEARKLRSPKNFQFYQLDLGTGDGFEAVLRKEQPTAVFHHAGVAYAGESSDKPLLYYDNNTFNTMKVARAMENTGVRKLIFSSSCATFGQADKMPVTEDTPQTPISVYGRSKLQAEMLLKDWQRSQEAKQADMPPKVAIMRYFNVIGSDPSARVGQWRPSFPEKKDYKRYVRLTVALMDAAEALLPNISVAGDGSVMRDYIHVSDVANAHVMMLQSLEKDERTERLPNLRSYNLGTGKAHSILEVIKAAKEATSIDFPVEFAEPRSVDPPKIWADSTKIQHEIGWHPQYLNLAESLGHEWRFRERRRDWEARSSLLQGLSLQAMPENKNSPRTVIYDESGF